MRSPYTPWRDRSMIDNKRVLAVWKAMRKVRREDYRTEREYRIARMLAFLDATSQ